METIVRKGKKTIPAIRAQYVHYVHQNIDPVRTNKTEQSYLGKKAMDERRRQGEARLRHTTKVKREEAETRELAARIAQRLACEDDHEYEEYFDDKYINLAENLDSKVGSNFRFDTQGTWQITL